MTFDTMVKVERTLNMSLSLLRQYFNTVPNGKSASYKLHLYAR